MLISFLKSLILKILNKYFTLVTEDIQGNVRIQYTKIKKLPEIVKYVNNNLYLNNNKLKTLKNCPKEVGFDFNCSNNELISLIGSPQKVTIFNCDNNQLKNLIGSPKEILGAFFCNGNKELKNIKEQIIENQIKAETYFTDEGTFTFKEIEKEFNEYIKNNNNKLKNIITQKDFGYSI